MIISTSLICLGTFSIHLEKPPDQREVAEKYFSHPQLPSDIIDEEFIDIKNVYDEDGKFPSDNEHGQAYFDYKKTLDLLKNHPNASNKVKKGIEKIQKGLKKKDRKDPIEEAADSQTSLKKLIKLTTHKYPGVRYEAAKNPTMPSEVLSKLYSSTKDGDVIDGITENRNTPHEILEDIYEKSRMNGDQTSVSHLLRNKGLSPELIERIREDQTNDGNLYDMANEIASNSNASSDTLNKMRKDYGDMFYKRFGKDMPNDIEGLEPFYPSDSFADEKSSRDFDFLSNTHWFLKALNSNPNYQKNS